MEQELALASTTTKEIPTKGADLSACSAQIVRPIKLASEISARILVQESAVKMPNVP
jgi:hypothetical protein